MKNHTLSRRSESKRSESNNNKHLKLFLTLLDNKTSSKNRKYTKSKHNGGGDFRYPLCDITPLTGTDMTTYFDPAEYHERLFSLETLNTIKSKQLGKGSTSIVHLINCKNKVLTSVMMRSFNSDLELNERYITRALGQTPHGAVPISETRKQNIIKDFKATCISDTSLDVPRLKKILPFFEFFFKEQLAEKKTDMRMAIELSDMGVGPHMYMCGILFKPPIRANPSRYSNTDSITANLFDISEKVEQFHDTSENLLRYLDQTDALFRALGTKYCNTDVKPPNFGVRRNGTGDGTVLFVDPGTDFNISDEILLGAFAELRIPAENIVLYRTHIMTYLYYLFIVCYSKGRSHLEEIENRMDAILTVKLRKLIILLCTIPESKILAIINAYHWGDYRIKTTLTILDAILPSDIDIDFEWRDEPDWRSEKLQNLIDNSINKYD